MDPITVTLGVGALGFGALTTYLRLSDPSKLGKLEAMCEKFGRTPGTVIHTIAYSVAPVVAGLLFVIAGLRGASAF